jgi:hypothetical protein
MSEKKNVMYFFQWKIITKYGGFLKTKISAFIRGNIILQYTHLNSARKQCIMFEIWSE